MQSHIGSTVAVRYASQWLATAVANPVSETDWRSLIESTAWALIEQAATLIDQPEVDAAAAEQLIATTLVCAVIDASSDEITAHVVAVGDSGAWLLDGTDFSRIGGGKSDAEGGLSSSAVSGLPRVPVEVNVASVEISAGQVLLLGTDGIGDPLGSGDGDVGRMFSRVFSEYVPSITEFGHMVDFSRETFDDDRTLVAVWPKGSLSSGSQ